MESLVIAQILEHCSGQRHHSILVALPAPDEELALFAMDVFDRDRQAFRQPQPATVKEFDRDPVPPQANGILRHGRPRMIVIERIRVLSLIRVTT